MSFGFPASYKTQFDLTGTRQTAREAIVYTFQLLEWKYEVVNQDLFLAKIPMSGSSWGESFSVSLANPGVAEIQSVCRYPLQLFDWGKNKLNVREFVAHFGPKEARDGKLNYKEPLYLDEDLNSPIDRVLKESNFRDATGDK